MTRLSRSRRERGFTLTELAIAFMLLALFLGGLLVTLSAQNAAREISETQRTLDQAREAIIGFAIRFGRLPCPAAPGTTGIEAFTNPGLPAPNTDLTCTNNFNGFVPALTLGLGPVDAQGYLLDAFGNRVRYSVSRVNGSRNPAQSPSIGSCPPNTTTPNYNLCPVFTTANAMTSIGLANLPRNSAEGLLTVCDNAGCSGTILFTPAVIWSPGRNFANNLATNPSMLGAAGADELENIDTEPPLATFVAHEIRPGAAPGGEFDDIVTWISPNILYHRLISAGAI
jgi:type II secretory pathway pseudopilin PulG